MPHQNISRTDCPTPTGHVSSLQSRPFGPTRTTHRTPSPFNPTDSKTLGPKVRGEGSPLPPPILLATGPLPLSAVLSDNKGGCAWPDRTSFRKKIQDGQQGPKALCRGVSGGGELPSLPCPKQAACQPRWLANSEVRRITQCAKSSPCNVHTCKNRNFSTTKNKKTTHRSPRFSKVLQHLPQAHGPQRDEVRAPLASAVSNEL